MNNETILKEYESKTIRCTYDNGKYYYSIIDVITILRDNNNARNYWKVLKYRLNDNQLVTSCNQLKLKSTDGKNYLSDVIDGENLLKLIEKIPSKNKDKFIKWFKNEMEIDKIENAEIIPYNREKIANLIYEIRGVQVMIDSDLAKLYKCKNGTKEINQAVRRNIKKFPSDFYFQLTEGEIFILRSQIVTAKKNSDKIRNLPYAFTEQGVAMLATIIKTDIASSVSVNIMRAFVLMRRYVSKELLEQRYIFNQTLKNTEDIKILQESFKKFEEKRKDNEIYFNGQIYDAYSKIIDIFKMAKKELIIIDGYADKVVLDMIRNIKVPVKLIVKKNKALKPLDIVKYNNQYNNLTVKYNNTFHDRYFIIDKEIVYHCGTSINHIGTKTFSINLLEDKELTDALIKKITN